VSCECHQCVGYRGESRSRSGVRIQGASRRTARTERMMMGMEVVL
jgi:hypothetical protein